MFSVCYVCGFLGGKVTGGAAGHLSVAAGALRFIGVVVTAAGARTFDKTLDLDQLQGESCT